MSKLEREKELFKMLQKVKRFNKKYPQDFNGENVEVKLVVEREGHPELFEIVEDTLREVIEELEHDSDGG